MRGGMPGWRNPYTLPEVRIIIPDNGIVLDTEGNGPLNSAIDRSADDRLIIC